MTRSDLETARIQELLATRATQGLDDADAAELERLGDTTDGFDQAAVMIDLVTLPREPLPAGLADKIFAAATRSASATAPSVPAVPKFTGAALAAVTPLPSPRTRASPWTWAGWGVAALAATAALWLWRSRPQPASEDVSPAAVRAELAATEDVARFSTVESGVSGTVMWSARRQRGVLQIAGLASNDPRRERYQIWIFDQSRDERYPVDGGVFDVTGPEEEIIEIRPRVQIERATSFWVTREAPTGAVVSDRRQVVLRTK